MTDVDGQNVDIFVEVLDQREYFLNRTCCMVAKESASLDNRKLTDSFIFLDDPDRCIPGTALRKEFPQLLSWDPL